MLINRIIKSLLKYEQLYSDKFFLKLLLIVFFQIIFVKIKCQKYVFFSKL